MKIYLQLLLIIGMCLSASLALANDRLKIHGFAAQGIIKADGSNFVNNDGDASLELTEVGINASYRISPNLRLSGQAVYLNGGNRFANGAKIDHLFLDWQIYNSLDSRLNLFLGRVKNYHRLYSSTRDVPHTRPSIILPQSLYIDVFRDISIGSDGAMLRGLTTNASGEWEANWNFGQASISGDQTDLFLVPQATGELSLEREHQGSIYWRPAESNIQFGVSFVNATFEYKRGDNDPVFDGELQTKGHYFNVRYYGEVFTLSTEYIRLRSESSGFAFPGFAGDSEAEGMYIQGEYLLSPKVTGVLRLDLYDRNVDDRNGSLLPMTTGLPSYFGFMDMATAGMSWQFKPNWKVQGEFHRVKGTGRLAPILVPDLENNSNKYWNIWAVQLMYWF